MARLLICHGCGKPGPWLRRDGRPIRCPTCERDADRHRNRRRLHYRGAYRARRAQALRTTGGRCAVPGCPTPLDRVEVHHVTEGDPASELTPLCHAHHVATFRAS